MTEANKGVLGMIAVCVIFGLSPILYKQLAHVPPLEVLCHRTIWSLVFLALLLMRQGRLAEVVPMLRGRRSLVMLVFASVMISLNWFIYIFAIQIGRTVESSLGYYIFPLLAVIFGMIFFGERLTFWKWISLALASLAVIILTYGLGVAPWISLSLALTFALYGVVKKLTLAGPVVSVTAEVLLLAPFAAIWLLGVAFADWTPGTSGAFGANLTDSLLLVFSGPLTAIPLILLSYASKRISLATLGLVQYLNPTLQFFCAVVLFGEPFTRWHGIAFSLIWIALAIYSITALRQERASRSA